MQLLKAHGADMSAVNKEGQSALAVAKNTKNSAAVVAVQEDAAALLTEVKTQARTDHIEDMLKHGADVNFADSAGNTPLIIAAKEGNSLVVDLLLRHGANPNLANHNGETAILFASGDRDLYAVKVLLAKGADALKADNQGRNAITVAKQKGYEDIAALIAAQSRR
jgi:ankyrin repeat protein